MTSDCRGNLRLIHEQFKKAHKGLHLRHGCEPEMMWLKKGADGLPAGGFSKPNCYHIDQFESLRPVFMPRDPSTPAPWVSTPRSRGIREDAPGQLELNWMFDDCLRTADRLTTYRQICAQVAREFDVIACFMSKPFMGVSASGCHHNLSLWRGGEERLNKLGHDKLPGLEENFTYLEGGENTFLPSERRSQAGPDQPSLHRRLDQARGRAHRDWLIDREFVPAALGHGLLGAGLRLQLGLPESHLRASDLRAGALRIQLGRLDRRRRPT